MSHIGETDHLLYVWFLCETGSSGLHVCLYNCSHADVEECEVRCGEVRGQYLT